MDSSSEADRVVQSVVSPSLPDGLLDANLSNWLPQSQWELGVEGFDTPPVSNQQTPEESDVIMRRFKMKTCTSPKGMLPFGCPIGS